MSEWWTYSLSSFLLFSPRTYYRLFEIYNAAIWPVQIVAMFVGLTIPVLPGRAPARSRVLAATLAACWLWVAIAFQAHRYATINWAATYFAWAFGLEAGLLVWIGAVRGTLRFERPADLAGRAGLGIYLFALLIEPLGGVLLGRGWKSVEIFGVAPDPTTVATLGLLLLARGRGRWVLLIVPVVWCVITGATLLAIHALDAWVAPLVAVLAISLAIWQGRASSAGRVRDPSLRSG